MKSATRIGERQVQVYDLSRNSCETWARLRSKGKNARDLMQKKAADPLADSVSHLVHQACQCTGVAFRGEAEHGDVTPRQYVVLAAVADKEGLSQTGLVERTGIDRSTITLLVRRMVKRGLLERRRNRWDARNYALKLTTAGRQRLQVLQPMIARVDQRILHTLPARNRQAFLRDLKMLVEALSVEDR